MDKQLYDLARLIKMLAKDVSKKDAWWKHEIVSRAIGLYETDTFFDEIRVTDDSGYRAITIGDTRGNISRVTGRRIAEDEHCGMMLLYRECREKKYVYRCFPSVEEICNRLQMVKDQVILRDEYAWYERTDPEALAYYSKVVCEHAQMLAKTGKTPKELFDACM